MYVVFVNKLYSQAKMNACIFRSIGKKCFWKSIEWQSNVARRRTNNIVNEFK